MTNNTLSTSLLQNIDPEAKVLDVGAGGFCGTVTTNVLLTRFRPENITLIEKDDNFFKGLSKFEKCNKLHADFFTYYFYNKYDLIVIDLDSINEFRDFQQILIKCYYMLNTGGHLIYYTVLDFSQIALLSRKGTPHADLIKQYIQMFYGSSTIVTPELIKQFFDMSTAFEFIMTVERNSFLQWVLIKKRFGLPDDKTRMPNERVVTKRETIFLGSKINKEAEIKSILTVAMPCYNSGKIAWLAMESLCEQKDVDFDWELVIAEETYDGANAFGYDRFMEYEQRLKQVGCISITYLPLLKKISLPEKWKYIANNSGANSIGFVLKASDCYSYPTRLKMSYDAMINGYDWAQCKKGFFYWVQTGQIILYNGNTINWSQNHLNMCLRTEYAKKLPFDKRGAGVDGWLFALVKEFAKGYPRVYNDESSDWMFGVDTHGLNNISLKRHQFFQDTKPPFEKTLIRIEEILPSKIVDELLKILNE